MKALEKIIEALGGKKNRFGILAKSDTSQLTVIANNVDVAVGDMFLLPCERGAKEVAEEDGETTGESTGTSKSIQRIYVFRTTEYSNIMNRTLEMNDVARNKLTMEDSYFSKELQKETLLELRGMVVGYAQFNDEEAKWQFFRPRRLPSHLTEVYRVERRHAPVIRELLADQLEEDGIRIGHLQIGEKPMDPVTIDGKKDPGVEVRMPIKALATHLGIFGRTGTGKSNLMMVLIESFLRHNENVHAGKVKETSVSLFAIDPHDEFCRWHESHTKLPKHGGVRQIVNGYTKAEKQALVDPFYYLTARPLGYDEKKDPLMQRLKLSYADITPGDLLSVLDFSEQQSMFVHAYYGRRGQDWIYELTNLSLPDIQAKLGGLTFTDGTIEAVQRRLSFLTATESAFEKFYSDSASGCDTYTSLLPDIICALETGRVVVVDSSHLGELEQFLITTIVARLLFSLRRALRSAESDKMIEEAIRQALDNGDAPRTPNKTKIGLRELAKELVRRLTEGEFRLPYLNPKAENGKRSLDELPLVSVVVEEAPSVLNPARMKFGSVFRDISRQGRKFRVGLTVVSQQVTEIDAGILSQINTQLILALGSDAERREAIKIASADLSGFQRELQVMDTGQLIFSASYKQLPLPVKVPNFDTI